MKIHIFNLILLSSLTVPSFAKMTNNVSNDSGAVTLNTKAIAIIEKHAQEILNGFHSKGMRLEITNITGCLLERYVTIVVNSDKLVPSNLVVTSSIQDLSQKSFFNIASDLGKDGQDCYLTSGTAIKRSFENYFEKLYDETGKTDSFNRNMPFNEIL